MAERVALLGTGIMGAPMARNLLKAGFQVRVWNRTPDKARVLAAEGADLAETPADAVREAAFVITMLIDAAAILAVMGQAAASVPDAAVWLQTSMVGKDAERVAGLAEDHGITSSSVPRSGPGRRPSAAGLSCLRPDPETSSTGHSRSSMRSGRGPSGSTLKPAGRGGSRSWRPHGPLGSRRASAPS
jgi:3-hydroxyisobutyrate dehydrogenase